MAEYKEYIVTLKDKTHLEEFYQDMETLGGCEKIPNRSVECACRRPISRNTHYWLTNDEVTYLKSDPRVIAVETKPSERKIFPRVNYEQSETYWNKSETITSDHKNWGLLRCVEGSQRTDWGSNITQNQSGAINVTSSGINVDVVIVDGGSFDHTHPEYAVNPDGTGGSRVILYDWFQHDMEVLGTAQTESYSYGFTSNHSAHVAGTVAGNTQGWARGANIYSIGYGVESVFDYVRAFHNNKPINPITGRKNPTIMNNSWGYNIAYDDLDPIIQISYRENTYDNPTEGDLASYGYKTAYSANGLPARVPAVDVDLEDCLTAGIISVGSAGNSDMKIDNPTGGLDFNNWWYDGTYMGHYHQGSSPCAAEGNICVGSIGDLTTEHKSGFSSCGPRVDIFSPGTNIISSVNGVYYPLTADDPRNSSYKISKISGTSMASPQVCGVLACALEQNPSMTQEQALEYAQHYAKTNQMSETSGGHQDTTDLQGAANNYLYYYKERPVEGVTYPKLNKDLRPSEGLCYPRQRIVITQSGTLQATGGTITESGGYRIHTFTSSGTFEIIGGYSELEYLIIAGGGGGGTSGANYCGGGGAGGLLQGNLDGFVKTYPVVVGAGGAAQNNGQPSSALDLATIGGGAGTSTYAAAGNAGGSGGGGGPINGLGGVGTAGQGNNGGVASSANQGGQDSGAGGGGGANEIGDSKTYPGPFSNSPGQGGDGIQSDITGTLLWYACGGVGSGYYSSANVRGIGGSVNGGTANGSTNTGSGGGGGRSGAGGAGGSGIVIIRYLM